MLWLRLYSSVGLLCRALASAPATLVRALQPWHLGLQVCRGHRLPLAVGPFLSVHSVACCVGGYWLRPCLGRITTQSSGCHFVAPLISSVIHGQAVPCCGCGCTQASDCCVARSLQLRPPSFAPFRPGTSAFRLVAATDCRWLSDPFSRFTALHAAAAGLGFGPARGV